MTKHRPDKAMVLAAGMGTRMRELTKDTPKPLIKVCEKPLIDYALDGLVKAGVQTAIVNVHYLADKIESHLTARRTPRILFSDERSQLLETGGGLKKAGPMLGKEPVFCTNTDAIIVDNAEKSGFEKLVAEWDQAKMDALLLLVPTAVASGYDGSGDFDLSGDTLVWRRGKHAAYVFTGLQIISPTLFSDTPDGPFSTRLLWEKAMAKERLKGVVHDGGWLHVGDPEGLAEAERFFKHG
ncbi:MAG: nucleotidyltransferase family protein [Parvularculaceae bacterium]